MRALLALFIRSLREDARARTTYIVRAALVSLVLFFLWMTHKESSWSGAVGLSFLRTVLWIDLFILTIVGLSYFASAITEEKEGETLGLLRMTNLNALSILLGKSTARMLGALFILGAQLPFMLVAVTMGGVALRQVYAGFACLFGYAFFLANLGLVWSVFARRTSVATAGTACSIGSLLVLPWWSFMGLNVQSLWSFEVLTAWRNLTPFARLGEILQTNFNESVFGWQFIVSIGVSLACFGLAWVLFDRFADTDGVAAPKGSKPSRAGKRVSRRAMGAALGWKDFHFIAGGKTAVVIKSVFTFLIAWGCVSTMGRGSDKLILFGALLTFWSALLLGCCLALDASRIFKRERDDLTLSSLMMLPIPSTRLAWDKMMGCLKASIPPAIGVAVGLVFFGIGILDEITRPNFFGGEAVFYGGATICYGLLTSMLLPVFIAWLSLRMRRAALPVGLTVWFFGNWITGIVLAFTMREGAFFLMPLTAGLLLLFTWISIPARLEQLAAEE